MKQIIFKEITKDALMVATACMVLCAIFFTLLEPALSLGQVNSVFTITQQIDGEISFTVPATNITMTGAIQGITGGNATGTTQAVVRTNQGNGYNMTIAFSTTTAMRGLVSGSTAIRDYGTSTAAEPTFQFTASSAALFAYSVTATTSTDVEQSFLNNGTICNSVGGSSTLDRCWKGPATSTFMIINRLTPAIGGATTTIKFVVNVPSNPSPALVQDLYQATATLTATNNP